MKDNTKQVLAEADRRLKAGITKACLLVEREAKKIVPVKTGTLKRSITHEVDVARRIGIVGSNVEYAPYVELGTRKWKGKPYLRPALLKSKKKIAAIFRGLK